MNAVATASGLNAQVVRAVRRETAEHYSAEGEPVEAHAVVPNDPSPDKITTGTQFIGTPSAAAAREALLAEVLASPADERLLAELAAEEVPLALKLVNIQKRMANRLAELVDHPAQALTVARVLQQVVSLSSVVTKRVQATLGASANLRAQRRFLSLRGGWNDK